MAITPYYSLCIAFAIPMRVCVRAVELREKMPKSGAKGKVSIFGSSFILFAYLMMASARDGAPCACQAKLQDFKGVVQKRSSIFVL
eukprot:3874867-Amphidinium_carterae.1